MENKPERPKEKTPLDETLTFFTSVICEMSHPDYEDLTIEYKTTEIELQTLNNN